MSWRARLLLSLLLAAGCSEPGGERRVAPVAHLVEPAADAGPPALAQLGGEGRPVLRGFPDVWLGRRFAERVDGTQRAEAWLPLPEALAGAERLLLLPEVSPPGGEGWEARAPRLVEVESRDGERGVRAEVSLEKAGPASGAWVRAQGRAPFDADDASIETAALTVPERARLELGFGVLEERSLDGAVVFSVSACADGDCTLLMQERLGAGDPSGTWHDRALPLDAFAGRTVSLRFDVAVEGEGTNGFVFPVWSDPVVLAPAEHAGRPNLLLVSLDTLRADRLPAYRYPLDTAPFLSERVAAEGVLFERAVAPADMTGPSHLTVFTSLPPSVHGSRSNVRPPPLPASIPTLASVLRAHGFTTGAVTEDGALAFGRGIERGFGSYREAHAGPEAGGLVEQTLAAGRAWIERHRDRRFFLFLHTYQPHTPYLPPERYPSLGHASRAAAERWRGRPGPETWQPENYDREIRYTDDALRAFFDALERDGVLDDTLVVLFSDHGEAFLEHGTLQHAGELHEEVLHVPLLMRGPGVARGHRVAAPVGLVDLMPTLLAWMDVPAPGTLMGRSFASLARGEDADASWMQRPIYSESWSKQRVELREGRFRSVDVLPPVRAVRVGSRKLIRERTASGHRDRYYDLAADPEEQVDLSARDPDGAADLLRLLDAYPAAMDASRASFPAEGEANDAAPPLDADREEALRALGYLE